MGRKCANCLEGFGLFQKELACSACRLVYCKICLPFARNGAPICRICHLREQTETTAPGGSAFAGDEDMSRRLAALRGEPVGAAGGGGVRTNHVSVPSHSPAASSTSAALARTSSAIAAAQATLHTLASGVPATGAAAPGNGGGAGASGSSVVPAPDQSSSASAPAPAPLSASAPHPAAAPGPVPTPSFAAFPLHPASASSFLSAPATTIVAPASVPTSSHLATPHAPLRFPSAPGTPLLEPGAQPPAVPSSEELAQRLHALAAPHDINAPPASSEDDGRSLRDRLKQLHGDGEISTDDLVARFTALSGHSPYVYLGGSSSSRGAGGGSESLSAPLSSANTVDALLEQAMLDSALDGDDADDSPGMGDVWSAVAGIGGATARAGARGAGGASGEAGSGVHEGDEDTEESEGEEERRVQREADRLMDQILHEVRMEENSAAPGGEGQVDRQ